MAPGLILLLIAAYFLPTVIAVCRNNRESRLQEAGTRPARRSPSFLGKLILALCLLKLLPVYVQLPDCRAQGSHLQIAPAPVRQ